MVGEVEPSDRGGAPTGAPVKLALSPEHAVTAGMTGRGTHTLTRRLKGLGFPTKDFVLVCAAYYQLTRPPLSHGVSPHAR